MPATAPNGSMYVTVSSSSTPRGLIAPDGSRYITFTNSLQSVPIVLAGSSTLASHTGDTNETALATITLAAAQWLPSSMLRLTSYWSVTNNGNNKTPRIRYNGIGGTVVWGNNWTTTDSIFAQTHFFNDAAGTGQFVPPNLNASFGNGSAKRTFSVNTNTSTPTIVLTGALGNAADTITLEAYYLEMIKL